MLEATFPEHFGVPTCSGLNIDYTFLVESNNTQSIAILRHFPHNKCMKFGLVILLMVQKSQGQPPFGCIKPSK